MCKNPFNEKRKAIGPIYTNFCVFIISKNINTRKIFILAFILFLVGFPLSSVITHSNLTLSDILIGDNVTIGANAVVINNIYDNKTVVGIPTRPIN